MSSDNYSTEPPYRPDLDRLLPGSFNGAVPPTDEPLQPIDQIALRKLGGFNFLTVTQWNELPPDMQLRRIQREEVVFLSRGQEVPVREALAYLKSVRDAEFYEQGQHEAYEHGQPKYPPPDTRRGR